MRQASFFLNQAFGFTKWNLLGLKLQLRGLIKSKFQLPDLGKLRFQLQIGAFKKLKLWLQLRDSVIFCIASASQPQASYPWFGPF